MLDMLSDYIYITVCKDKAYMLREGYAAGELKNATLALIVESVPDDDASPYHW